VRRLSAKEYVSGIIGGDRSILARAVTLIESELIADQELAATILQELLPRTGCARRVGISGMPGAGKSSLLERLGMHIITDYAETVAVLTVDPSSPLSGGSILGDKTRMPRLAAHDLAFVRPSPARGHLGGVARRTRETMLICEAAGYENVLIETVGVGQSETAVRSMTDFFLLLLIPGAGDELQAIKRGILEISDAIAVNKAEGQNRPACEAAAAQYRGALHFLADQSGTWQPRVVLTSALTGEGVPELWSTILEHRVQIEASGALAALRTRQSLDWMHQLIASGLDQMLQADPVTSELVPRLEAAVRTGSMLPSLAAQQLLSAFANRERG
jgi:LAO/AO transport system kinase